MKSRMTLLGCLLALAACGGGADGHGQRDPAGAKRSPTASSAPKPEPILLGTQRYASPCRLLDSEDVVRIYGDPGPYAYFTQRFLEKSISQARMRSITGTVAASVPTTCRYVFDDKAQTAIDLTVDQYVSPAAARRQWRSIKHLGKGIDSKQLADESGPEWLIKLARENEASMGGVPVRELDPSILFVAGKTQFTGVRRNLVLTVSRKSYAGSFFEPKQLKDALRTTREVFGRIYAKVDDQQLEQVATPVWWGQPQGWPEFLDPCAVFDDTVMRAATGHGTVQVESTSVARDPDTRIRRNTKPGDQAVYNECLRTARVKAHRRTKASWTGTVQLVYGAPGDTGQALLDGVVLRRFFKIEAKAKYSIADVVKAKLLHPVKIPGADAAYLFQNTYKGHTFGWIAVNVGPYVAVVDITRMDGLELDSHQVSRAARLSAAASVAANIRKATEAAD